MGFEFRERGEVGGWGVGRIENFFIIFTRWSGVFILLFLSSTGVWEWIRIIVLGR